MGVPEDTIRNSGPSSLRSAWAKQEDAIDGFRFAGRFQLVTHCRLVQPKVATPAPNHPADRSRGSGAIFGFCGE